MSCRDVRARLDGYLEDALSPDERRRVEDHLSTCDACRGELTSIGALLDTAQDLQRRQLEPGRDLWPEIRRRLAEPAARDGRAWRERLGLGRARLVWPFAAAAAILFLALGPGSSYLSRRLHFGAAEQGNAGVVGSQERESSGLARQMAALDAEVATARRQVSQAAAADSTGGHSWRTFDDNLQVLDRAIRESRAALAQDPENPVLRRTILGAYQKQLDLLRWASRLLRQG